MSGTPALAADPIKRELRGCFRSFMTAGKIDRDIVGATGINYDAVTLRYEAEIWFS